MQLGKFEVTLGAQRTASGKFVGTASVVWHDGDVTHDEPWSFNEECDTPAEAEAFAAERITKLYVGDQLGKSN